MESNQFIAVIGLGYVGFPWQSNLQKNTLLLVLISIRSRVNEVMNGQDQTLEIEDRI